MTGEDLGSAAAPERSAGTVRAMDESRVRGVGPRSVERLAPRSAERLPPRSSRQRGRWVSRIVFFTVFFGLFWLLTRLPALFDAAGLNRVPVAGRVWIDGEPASTVRLVFVPLERSFDQSLQPIAVATTDERGRFRLSDLQGNLGAARGRHLVFAVTPVAERGVEQASPEPADQAAGAGERRAGERRVPERLPGLGGRGEPGGEGEEFGALGGEGGFDPWRDASDLVGYWVQPNTLRGEVAVPLLGIDDLELNWGRRSTHENP